MNNNFKVKTKVQIVNNEVFFGPGLVKVLKEINDAGSVKEASRITGISYSKIWKIIRTAEKEVGFDLVVRSRGGALGGVAHTTKQCDEMIKLYEKLSNDVSNYAKKQFGKIFNNK